MAVIATYEARHSDAMYHYMRALAAPVPFSTARENLLTFFARLGSKASSPRAARRGGGGLGHAARHVPRADALFTREAPLINPNP